MTKKMVRIFEGKSKKMSRKRVKICKNVYILFKTLDIFSSGPAVGSSTPGPASPDSKNFRGMNGAHSASPIRGELGYAHWPQLGTQFIALLGTKFGPFRANTL